MIWLITIVGGALLFPYATFWERHHEPDGVGWAVAGFFLFIIGVGAALGTFFPTLATQTTTEAFYYHNAAVMREAVDASRDAVILHGEGDLNIQIENQAHSKETVARIVELRDAIKSYNETIQYYGRLKKLEWLWWPVVQYPETPPISLGI